MAGNEPDEPYFHDFVEVVNIRKGDEDDDTEVTDDSKGRFSINRAKV